MTKVFYSWQSDTPSKTGRNLVRKALLEAIKQLEAEHADVEEADRSEVVLDSDTQGVSGSPPIVETIFGKIDAAAVFVADLTFVGLRSNGKPTPNPNVAIEYGYALKSLSHARIVGVMNDAYGPPTRETLPFDLGHLRFPITYNCPENADEDARSAARSKLATALKPALRGILALAEATAPPPRVPYASIYPASSARFRHDGEPAGVFSGVPRQVSVADGPAFWLRLLPTVALPDDLMQSDIRRELFDAGTDPVWSLNDDLDRGAARPFNGPDGQGFASSSDEGGAVTRLVYVFKSGEVWSLDLDAMRYQSDRVAFSPPNFVAALQRLGDLLKRLGVPGPYRWIAGADGLANRRIFVMARPYAPGHPKPCLADSVVREGTYSGNKADAERSIEPFVARVIDEGGQRRHV